MNNATIGAALLGGYVLGRTRKAKLALGLGALLAGSRIRPGQVGKALQESPSVHDLTDQVRSELTDAGKAAATSVLTAKADSLAEALHQRTAGLRERTQGRAEDEEGEEGEKGEWEEDEEDEEEQGEEEEESADEDADDDADENADDDYEEGVDEDREPDDRYDDTDEEPRPTRGRRG
ncbi:ABC transporter substrate-binding protein [Streptomyces sp. NPDC007808]|uniref:ABC transporter substrate-binding protein n=1 Tax=Streptomyces sp. NPDC007808 TaxID=3364779 RepID=UPI0036AA5B46